MSRSRKKKPISGWTCCESEKRDKRFANRKLRRKVRIEVSKGCEVLSAKREVSNPYEFGKDGKQYWREKSYRAYMK